MIYTLPPKKGNPHYPMPPDYSAMSQPEQRAARISLLTSWYDTTRPNVLMTDKEMFRVAFRFYVNTYKKSWMAARGNDNTFFWRDCRWMPYWIRAVSHPLSAIAGFRGSSKTVWLVRALSEFVAVCRPGTQVLVSEYNDTFTDRVLGCVRNELENNDILGREFGRQHPVRGSGKSWTDSDMQLLNGSQIFGISSGSAMRGPHPALIILDDMEVDRDSMRQEWRDRFIENTLFEVIMGMRNPGSHVVWAGTFLNPSACLVTAVLARDLRFKHWHRLACPLIVRKTVCPVCAWSALKDIDLPRIEQCPRCEEPLAESGGQQPFTDDCVSMWPEKYSIADARAMLGDGTPDGRIAGMGHAAFWTEMMCKPVLSGGLMFVRDPIKNSYAFTKDGEEEKVVNHTTGTKVGKEAWLSTLAIAAGVDPAYTLTAQADFSAVVIVGSDHHGDSYILDAWRGKKDQYSLVTFVLALCEEWKATRIGWEQNMDPLLLDMVRQQLAPLAESGRYTPALWPIKHKAGVSKGARVVLMQDPMVRGRVKFPDLFAEKREGIVRRHSRHLVALTEEFDRFSAATASHDGKSGTGNDDLIDAAEMAMHVNKGRTPSAPVELTFMDRFYRDIEKAKIPLSELPRTLWTEKHVADMVRMDLMASRQSMHRGFVPK